MRKKENLSSINLPNTWGKIHIPNCTSHDPIEHPKHYTQGIECIDYIQSHRMDFLQGNVIKYVTRFKLKNGVEDLLKCLWYLKRLIVLECKDESEKKSYIEKMSKMFEYDENR